MSLSLLLPLGLAALAALVVPILIHLVRRPEHQLIDFAALRWLSERVRPRRRLRFEDPWLLLARNYDTATMRANYRLTVPRGTTELIVQP